LKCQTGGECDVWHEILGIRRVPVTVGASGEVNIIVTFARGATKSQ